MKGLFQCLIVLLTILLTACANNTPYDYSALEKSAPRSILVIPPLNETVEVNAQYTYLSTISKPLAEKGYYVFPVAVIDTFLKENGLPTPAEMNTIPLDKIREHIGADAVLYVSIEEWGQKYQVVSSSTIVKAKLKLVDVVTGELLWDADAESVRSSDSGNNGLAGMLISAVINQIHGSIKDFTPEVSRMANNLAINNAYRGLLNGPYAKAEEQEDTNAAAPTVSE